MKDILTAMDEADIELRKLGTNSYRGFCPFHDDGKTPNFTVYADTDSWYCFACGIGGSTTTFLQKFYGISYDEAVSRVHGEELCAELLSRLDNLAPVQDYKQALNRTISGIAHEKLSGADQAELSRLMSVLEGFDSSLRRFDSLSYDQFQSFLKNTLLLL